MIANGKFHLTSSVIFTFNKLLLITLAGVVGDINVETDHEAVKINAKMTFENPISAGATLASMAQIDTI